MATLFYSKETGRWKVTPGQTYYETLTATALAQWVNDKLFRDECPNPDPFDVWAEEQRRKDEDGQSRLD